MRAVTQVNLIEPRYEVDGGQPLVYGEAITGLPGSGIGKESEKADRTIRGCSRAARVLREHMNLGDPDSGAWRSHWFQGRTGYQEVGDAHSSADTRDNITRE